jgi:hypothetical protein
MNSWKDPMTGKLTRTTSDSAVYGVGLVFLGSFAALDVVLGGRREVLWWPIGSFPGTLSPHSRRDGPKRGTAGRCDVPPA